MIWKQIWAKINVYNDSKLLQFVLGIYIQYLGSLT